MRVYCTSMNNGPDYSSASKVTMLYLGTTLHEAEEAVGDFKKYIQSEADFPKNFSNSYSAIPATMDREMVKFYSADGWWRSIVMFDLNP